MAKNYQNCIYILTNPLYAGYVKIGYASDLNSRLSSLNTGMLRNFDVYAVYETPTKLADKQFHDLIDDLAPIVRARVIAGQKIQDKEFFKLEPEQAYDLFKHIAIMSGTEKKLHKYGEEDDTTADAKPTTNAVISNQSNTPVAIRINGINYPFESWINSLVFHCEKVIEVVGFDVFKTVALGIKFNNKQSTRKIFATTEADMGRFAHHKFKEGELYLMKNYSSDSIQKINNFLNEDFPKVKMDYVY